MERTIDVPLQLVEDVATLRLPEKAEQHLQQLMDRNNEGLLAFDRFNVKAGVQSF